MRLAILGPPGAGKGTQAPQLARHLGVPHISTGDLLRVEVMGSTELGARIRATIEGGLLVPDQLVIQTLAVRLAHPDAMQRGFLLDGFPRTVEQARTLARFLAPDSLDAVIVLVVETDAVVRRLALRGRSDDTRCAVRTPPGAVPPRDCSGLGVVRGRRTAPRGRRRSSTPCRRGRVEPPAWRTRLLECARDVDDLVELMRRYFALMQHADDFTLMDPFGGETSRESGATEECIVASDDPLQRDMESGPVAGPAGPRIPCVRGVRVRADETDAVTPPW